MVIARRFVITGIVQGVGFRWFVLRRARDLDVRGWARNRPDGTVEVHAEGRAEALENLEKELRRGPRGAGVSGVVSEDIEPTGGDGDFSIR